MLTIFLVVALICTTGLLFYYANEANYWSLMCEESLEREKKFHRIAMESAAIAQMHLDTLRGEEIPSDWFIEPDDV